MTAILKKWQRVDDGVAFPQIEPLGDDAKDFSRLKATAVLPKTMRQGRLSECIFSILITSAGALISQMQALPFRQAAGASI